MSVCHRKSFTSRAEACPEGSNESETACHGLCWASQSTKRVVDIFHIKLIVFECVLDNM